uniref:Uncharacterized protein n=1 Tax=Cacopsylla melanoneura TaxID=428564 RepID=A0A8D9E3I8_9HEMI
MAPGYNFLTHVQLELISDHPQHMSQTLVLVLTFVRVLRDTTQQQAHPAAVLFRIIQTLLDLCLTSLQLNVLLFNICLTFLQSFHCRFNFDNLLHHHTLENLEGTFQDGE